MRVNIWQAIGVICGVIISMVIFIPLFGMIYGMLFFFVNAVLFGLRIVDFPITEAFWYIAFFIVCIIDIFVIYSAVLTIEKWRKSNQSIIAMNPRLILYLSICILFAIPVLGIYASDKYSSKLKQYDIEKNNIKKLHESYQKITKVDTKQINDLYIISVESDGEHGGNYNISLEITSYAQKVLYSQIIPVTLKKDLNKTDITLMKSQLVDAYHRIMMKSTKEKYGLQDEEFDIAIVLSPIDSTDYYPEKAESLLKLSFYKN